jgi:uncharacterized membrane protein
LSRLGERLPAFLAGASAGLLVAWLASRPRAGRSVEPAAGPRLPSGEAQRARGRWAETWDDAMETLASARERFLPPAPQMDVEGLRSRLAGLPEGRDLEIRDLGEGIVEVIGHAEDQEVVQRVLDVLAAAPGVNVVVNRVWTPSSLSPGDAQLPSPGQG